MIQLPMMCLMCVDHMIPDMVENTVLDRPGKWALTTLLMAVTLGFIVVAVPIGLLFTRVQQLFSSNPI